MRLTNEQIEQVLNDAPDGATHIDEDERYWRFEVRDGQSFIDVFVWHWQEMNACLSEMFSLENLREILSLRKELEVSNSIQNAYREKSEKLSEYIKQLEQDAERGESGENGVV